LAFGGDALDLIPYYLERTLWKKPRYQHQMLIDRLGICKQRVQRDYGSSRRKED
jgi:hypothetical protein